MADVLINETFSEEEPFDSQKQETLDSHGLFELALTEKAFSHETFDSLKAHPLYSHNLMYDLPYQREGALTLLKNHNATALLADEVGLGKTITTGMVIAEGIHRGLFKHILVLCPPSLADQWKEELLEKFSLTFSIIESPPDWEHTSLAIASIDRVKIFNKQEKEFRHKKAHDISWDLVIVDEAHKLKEKNTIRWRFVDRLQKKRFLLLTATPFQNDLLELYNLLHLLKKGHLGTLREFRSKFLYKGNRRYPLNPLELKSKLQEVMIRRRRDETGIVYKKRIPKIVSVALTKEERMIYENTVRLLKESYFHIDGSKISGSLIVFSLLPKVTSSSRSAIESLQAITHNEKYHEITRQFAQGILDDYKRLQKDSKIEALLKIIKEIQERGKKESHKNGEKILIYTRHPSTLRYIVEKLEPFNYRIIEFMGGLSREEKTRRIHEFKQGNADILISTDTGAEGLNFQFCRNLINYDLPWNPMAVEQRIGRLDRIGQERDMHIYSLATKNTMEEHVVDLIINKMCCVGLVIGELPIILFNLGLDTVNEESKRGKIEELLINNFIDAKGNLDIFSQGVDKIAEQIATGMKEYEEDKQRNKTFLDETL